VAGAGAGVTGAAGAAEAGRVAILELSAAGMLLLLLLLSLLLPLACSRYLLKEASRLPVILPSLLVIPVIWLPNSVWWPPEVSLPASVVLPMRTPLAEELAAVALAVWLPDITGWLAAPGLVAPGLFGCMLLLLAEVVFLWP
jgi:hypothetical protein